MSELACEVCGKSPAEAELWILCPNCYELLSIFIEFARKQNVDAKDLEPLKQALKMQAKEIGLV